MILLDDIREQIKAAIKESGLTQKALAEKIGVKQQTISEYMNNISLPALDTFARLIEVLDVDPYEILCLKKTEQINKYKQAIYDNHGTINQKINIGGKN